MEKKESINELVKKLEKEVDAQDDQLAYIRDPEFRNKRRSLNEKAREAVALLKDWIK